MKYDFADVEDVQNFETVPPGLYALTVADVRVGETRNGDARWSFRLDVEGGEFSGRVACWDALIWSERAAPRTKKVLAAMGFDVSGEVQVEPHQLLGRRLRAELRPSQWQNPTTGVVTRRLEVPFDGFLPRDDGEADGEEDPDADPVPSGPGGAAGGVGLDPF